MVWTTIMQGNSLEEFKHCTPTIADLPRGTPIRLTINTTVPVAPIANVLGAEWLAEQLLANECKVIDVRSVGWYKVVVDAEALGVAPVIIAAIIVAAIFAFGFLIYAIKMEAGIVPSLDWVKWVAIGLVAIAVLVYLPKPKKREV